MEIKKIKVKKIVKGKAYAIKVTPKDKNDELLDLFILRCPLCGHIYYTKNPVKDIVCSNCSEKTDELFKKIIESFKNIKVKSEDKSTEKTEKTEKTDITEKTDTTEDKTNKKRKGCIGKNIKTCAKQVVYPVNVPKLDEKFDWLKKNCVGNTCNKTIAINLIGILARGYTKLEEISKMLGYCKKTTEHYLYDIRKCGLVLKVNGKYMINPAIKYTVK